MAVHIRPLLLDLTGRLSGLPGEPIPLSIARH